MQLLLSISIVLFMLGCSSASNKSQTPLEEQKIKMSYLALGDSYTIGESVEESLRWPVQLSRGLSKEGIEIEDPRIIATTGWTTDELKAAIEEAKITEEYDLVSLLIGVNNQYRGYPFDQYEKEFEELLQMALKFAGNKTNRVFVVSIPDYGVTPFGQKKDPLKIAAELDQYNAKAKELSEDKGIVFINITDISKKALNDSSLVASDQLHPSGKMYTQWVERISPSVKALLK